LTRNSTKGGRIQYQSYTTEEENVLFKAELLDSMEIESCEIKTNEGERFLNSNLWISCHYTHLPKGCNMEDILKSQIETVDSLLKCMSRKEWNINFYSL